MSVKPEVVKQLAELVDGDQWAMADLLAEEFPPEEYGDGSTSANSGLHDAFRQYETALAQERGIELKAATMRTLRNTAIKWPRDTRVSRASFSVHRYLLGEDRYQRMERYLRRNGGKPLSARIVKRFRYDDNPPPKVEWDARLRRRLTATVRSALLGGVVTKRPDWWLAAGPNDRAAAIAALRDIAKMLEQESA